MESLGAGYKQNVEFGWNVEMWQDLANLKRVTLKYIISVRMVNCNTLHWSYRKLKEKKARETIENCGLISYYAGQKLHRYNAVLHHPNAIEPVGISVSCFHGMYGSWFLYVAITVPKTKTSKFVLVMET